MWVNITPRKTFKAMVVLGLFMGFMRALMQDGAALATEPLVDAPIVSAAWPPQDGDPICFLPIIFDKKEGINLSMALLGPLGRTINSRNDYYQLLPGVFLNDVYWAELVGTCDQAPPRAKTLLQDLEMGYPDLFSLVGIRSYFIDQRKACRKTFHTGEISVNDGHTPPCP